MVKAMVPIAPPATPGWGDVMLVWGPKLYSGEKLEAAAAAAANPFGIPERLEKCPV